ncbi:MAG: sulfatase-like hydrolase/transferase, partial [Planctomycetota bacterium]|nr:sulfatase-like hydrolase/transferase [Planctomycetota bacterium]
TRRPTRYPNPGLEINGKQVDYGNGEYGPDVVSDYLIDFLRRNKGGPFFAYYPMILPHWPFQPTPASADWDPQETKEWPRKKWDRAHFRDMVHYTDKIVGKIDNALRELGIRDNTLLIFTADNGTATSITSPFRGEKIKGGKGATTDAGTHVPMIANWPSTIAPGAVSQDLIDFSDFVPTLAELGGARLPQDRPIDGRSFAAQLRGQPGKPRDWIYCWYSRPGGVTGREFARNQRYKLYRSGEFYDIKNDRLEKRPSQPAALPAEARQAWALLQSALQQFSKARPDNVF